MEERERKRKEAEAKREEEQVDSNLSISILRKKGNASVRTNDPSSCIEIFLAILILYYNFDYLLHLVISQGKSFRNKINIFWQKRK